MPREVDLRHDGAMLRGREGGRTPMEMGEVSIWDVGAATKQGGTRISDMGATAETATSAALEQRGK